MFQLVYISSAREQITAGMLDAILTKSRSNNERDGVTGLLITGTRRFLQALEGSEQAVWDAYARIKNDPRHHALVLLTGRAVETRAFGNWAMACQESEEGPHQQSLADTVRQLTDTLADKSLRAQFVGFAELHGKPA